MTISCEFGQLVAVIMLGCHTNGPKADDEVMMATSVPVVGGDVYFQLNLVLTC
jgi:hypothetical protein